MRVVYSFFPLGCGVVLDHCEKCKIPGFNGASTITKARCTGCVPGYLLSKEKCVTKCPSNSFASNSSTCIGLLFYCFHVYIDTNMQLVVQNVRHPAKLVRRSQRTVSLVQMDSWPRMVNASINARLGLSRPRILVSIVIPIAKPARDPLTHNVYHVPQNVLLKILDVAYQRVYIKPSTSTRKIRNASAATLVAPAAPVLGLLNVWDVLIVSTM